MRILITVKWLSGGGAERVASLWANGFAQRGNDVSIVTMLPNDFKYHLDERIRLTSLNISGYPIVKQLKYIRRLREYVKANKPDVIISLLNPGALYAKCATIGLGIPIINTEHNCFERPKEEPMSYFERVNKFCLNNLYNCVTVLTEADFKLARKSVKNVVVLPNPLSFEPVNAIPVRENKHILSVGRLDSGYCKGFDILLAAFKEVHERYKDWSLEIAGGGSESSFAKYLELAKDLGIEDCTEFSGFTADIKQKYQNSPIFVSASRFEGFGMAIIEAMSQGCACISSSFRGRQEEIIRDETEGIVYCDNNAHTLAQNIMRLIEDKDLLNHIQTNSIERSKDFSLDIIMNKWEQILNEAL